MKRLFFDSKPVIITTHAIKQARIRNIECPDQIFQTILGGKAQKLGKHHIKWIKKSKKGSIICIGVQIGSIILIKTVARGN